MNMLLEYSIQMRPNSLFFTFWKKPPTAINMGIYVFNFTNPVEFLSGKEKLKVQEIGPYVYKEHIKNDNVTFNDNGTISFITRREVTFVPEMSINDPTKVFINVPNVIMLGASSALHDAGFLMNYPFLQLTNILDAQPILNMSVYDYLWGYEDSLVSLASNIMPNFINFQKFGLMDRMYDEGENIITMYIKKNADMKDEKGRYLSIDKYNGSPGLEQWGYINTKDNETRKENTACNILQGTMDGLLFPPHLDKDATFRIYRKVFCRPLPIMYRKEITAYYGLPGYYYTFMDDFADPPEQNPNNKCYCPSKKICLKKGLINVTPCYYNIPSAISFPHFLDADPSLLEDIDGLSPDQEKHGSHLILQQTTGVPLYIRSRMQTNLVIYHTRYNSKIRPFNDKVIPLFWFDTTLPEAPIKIIFILKLILQILPMMQTILMYLFGIGGVTMIIWSFVHILRVLRQQRKKEQEVPRQADFDLRMPLCNGQCTSLTILPTVKKIT
ncbi:scavenger receptor class B member 1-like isoform X2 [Odontomachus brunneus]|nr:scavenger receptor class B member 1-like isoform X2 [Odontomachus brunneus]